MATSEITRLRETYATAAAANNSTSTSHDLAAAPPPPPPAATLVAPLSPSTHAAVNNTTCAQLNPDNFATSPQPQLPQKPASTARASYAIPAGPKSHMHRVSLALIPRS
ncbi:hypothetical protein KC19_4G261400 [Ceratodon purpureus]|uniref:Uncharacterized protein n=1 Tax=Ceratodon purpureus TaxID=3225 RepID=A0A8T0IF78_CERPU|nr:hypothetical protein KC19_4G261400 [Ceratodon purpureus]